jgi:hypothetical protein
MEMHEEVTDLLDGFAPQDIAEWLSFVLSSDGLGDVSVGVLEDSGVVLFQRQESDLGYFVEVLRMAGVSDDEWTEIPGSGEVPPSVIIEEDTAKDAARTMLIQMQDSELGLAERE